MKQSIIAWLCVMTLAACPGNPHTAERLDNADKAAHHQLALEKCYNDAIATYQTTQDFDKADREYKDCADNADREAGLIK